MMMYNVEQEPEESVHFQVSHPPGDFPLETIMWDEQEWVHNLPPPEEVTLDNRGARQESSRRSIIGIFRRQACHHAGDFPIETIMYNDEQEPEESVHFQVSHPPGEFPLETIMWDEQEWVHNFPPPEEVTLGNRGKPKKVIYVRRRLFPRN
jgi:hypothetical protein